MKRLVIPYRVEDHGSIDEEWPIQRRTTGWWYITGYFSAEGDPDRLWTYQFTVAKAWVWGLKPWWLQLALTDIATGEHRCTQRVLFHERKDAYVSQNTVHFRDLAELRQEDHAMVLRERTSAFELDLVLEHGKGFAWHGEGGVIRMGGEKRRHDRMVYGSYPGMPTAGTLRLREERTGDRVLRVTGRSWFDRQWGRHFNFTTGIRPWEWLSLRFFDDEEVMLFDFPQKTYQDGTYIARDGTNRRIRDFSCTPTGLRQVEGMTFSHGWELTMPGIKDERYSIRPLTRSQYNFFYIEELAGIHDRTGRQVGLCMAELIPGARNPKDRLNPFRLLRKQSGGAAGTKTAPPSS